MKNVKKMVVYAERELIDPEKIKHLRGDKGQARRVVGGVTA
jgi:hypothetical protein